MRHFASVEVQINGNRCGYTIRRARATDRVAARGKCGDVFAAAPPGTNQSFPKRGGKRTIGHPGNRSLAVAAKRGVGRCGEGGGRRAKKPPLMPFELFCLDPIVQGGTRTPVLCGPAVAGRSRHSGLAQERKAPVPCGMLVGPTKSKPGIGHRRGLPPQGQHHDATRLRGGQQAGNSRGWTRIWNRPARVLGMAQKKASRAETARNAVVSADGASAGQRLPPRLSQRYSRFCAN